MAHCITAIIGEPTAIGLLAAYAGCPAPIGLPQGLAIAALGEDQFDRLTSLEPGAYREGFRYLAAALEEHIVRASHDGAVAYIETEYFGGIGGQSAIVASNGTVLLCASEQAVAAGWASPINRALVLLGVQLDLGCDPFATIGLDEYRDNEALGLSYPRDESA